MKKLLTILLLLLSLNVVAQNHRERVKALKVSFITEMLDLTEKEAQKFWPVYNEHDKKIVKIRYQDIRSIRKEIKNNIESLTDAQASDLLLKLDAAEDKLHKLNLEFSKKLSGIISPKKIILLKIAEEDFKRRMLDELKRRKRGKE
ncbi:sensor of ECF-type sigma factor [uncultured Algibacter sp.]|uniref:sensor of ECF-type sigma factor n=1 Tax=uncultured Algibacter sp. TaxID=298659 RepID=UPI00263A3C8D|nr:sensor of ECF-type sigma factor [uncultured Algibacter sp.]